MQSRRLIFFFKIWAVAFATTLYFAQAIIAQSHEQRLIRLVVPMDALNAKETTKPLVNDHPNAPDFRNETEKEKEQKLPLQDFVVYGRAKEAIGAGIALGEEKYRPILYAREPEFNNIRKPNLERMPDLESFFTFGGTLELLTSKDPPLEKLDIVISELMWGVDTGVKDDRYLYRHRRRCGYKRNHRTYRTSRRKKHNGSNFITPQIEDYNRRSSISFLHLLRASLNAMSLILRELNTKSLTQSAPYISGNGSCREKAAEDRIPPSFLPIAT